MPKLPPKLAAIDNASALWMLYPPIFVAVYLLHLTLLRLPYFWDEGGYYIPAAWDFFRFGKLIPVSTMRNAHPPLPSVLLAAWWKIAGFHIYSTRLFICLIAALALLAVYRLGRTFSTESVALVATVLTAIYPVWFAQSTLAHADIFAAAATLWALVFYFSQKGPALCLVFFALSVMAKETAIVTPAALAAYELYLAWRSTNGERRYHLRWFAWIAATVLPLIAWYVYHHAATGFTFGNPEYLRYNATANLSVHRVLLSVWHRLVHLTFHMNLWVVTACTLAVLFLTPLKENGEERIALPQRVLLPIAVIVVANWIAFSILGGALLTRYLLPVYPLLLLVAITLWRQRFQYWPVIAAIALAGFAVACKVNPNYPYAPEDNLAYRDMIVLHQQAIALVAQHFPQATVLTAWPVAADLIRPELGYVKTPLKMTPLENFSAAQIFKAAQEQDLFDTAIVFSTKYLPPGTSPSTITMPSDARYFDFHDDLKPQEIARILHGDVVWEKELRGEWAAVLRFPRASYAMTRDR